MAYVCIMKDTLFQSIFFFNGLFASFLVVELVMNDYCISGATVIRWLLVSLFAALTWGIILHFKSKKQ
ncbi:MAG: hypothetical protein ACWA41_00695 [Putridiphycobacter sp.]